MGVSGAGKTTVGRMLAERLDFDFRDADDLHPRHNVERMATGHPLGDEDRWPWLDAVGQYLIEQRAHERGTVMACSALKRSYRDVLREHVPDSFFVFLDGPMPVVHERIYGRSHEFMPPTLLASQYQSLEPLADDEWGLRVDIKEPPEHLVETVCRALADAPTPAALRDS